jgi:hypothetical protein
VQPYDETNDDGVLVIEKKSRSPTMRCARWVMLHGVGEGQGISSFSATRDSTEFGVM